MSNKFDPYHRWLSIRPEEQPADHYRLLGIVRLEDDPEVIRDAAERQIAHIRRYALGEHAAVAQEILTELSKAKACLLVEAKKAEYDRGLRDPITSPARNRRETPREANVSVNDSLQKAADEGVASEAPSDETIRHLRPGLSGATSDSVQAQPVTADSTEKPEPVAPSSSIAKESSNPNTVGETAQKTMRKRSPEEPQSPSPKLYWYWIGGVAVLIVIVVILALAPRRPSRSASSSIAPNVNGKTKSTVLEPLTTRTAGPPRSPVIADIPSQSVDEGEPLEITFHLADAGAGEALPRFRLLGRCPAGLTMDGVAGVLHWTPSEEQGPGAFDLTVQASRQSKFEVVDEKSFTITVREVNQPPQLARILNKSAKVGEELRFVLKADDPDVPANDLRYELLSAPAGADLDLVSGRFGWTPGSDVANSDVIVGVRVTDNGSPAQYVEQEFRIRVEGPPLTLAPFDEKQAQAHQEVCSKHLNRPVEIKNSIGMTLVLIPPGEFLMGSPDDEPDRHRSELQHRVRITQPFWLGIHEVTQQQYQRLMGSNPSYFSASGVGKDRFRNEDTRRFPVDYVSWEDAVEFCRRLNMLPEERRSGFGYRLPTEAEWEYACRAGNEAPFHFGLQLDGHEANCDGDSPYGTRESGPHLGRTTAVGSYSANGFGIYDMHGNVWEWCADWYDSNYYAASPQDDPRGPKQATDRVHRGGSWNYDAKYCRAACRLRSKPSTRDYHLGFRVVLLPYGK